MNQIRITFAVSSYLPSSKMDVYMIYYIAPQHKSFSYNCTAAHHRRNNGACVHFLFITNPQYKRKCNHNFSESFHQATLCRFYCSLLFSIVVETLFADWHSCCISCWNIEKDELLPFFIFSLSIAMCCCCCLMDACALAVWRGQVRSISSHRKSGHKPEEEIQQFSSELNLLIVFVLFLYLNCRLRY